MSFSELWDEVMRCSDSGESSYYAVAQKLRMLDEQRAEVLLGEFVFRLVKNLVGRVTNFANSV